MRIGVDLGGTNVRVALVDYDKIVDLITEPCKASEPENVVVDHICSMISSLITDNVDYIGVGVPSVVDTERGIVYNVANIPSWKEVHLKEALESKFNVYVAVNNDCNFFALGVCAFDEGKHYKNVVCVTLGTGVGAGIIIDKKLYIGNNTGAGEIGSIQYLDATLEDYCSSQFFARFSTTAYDSSVNAKNGSLADLRLWEKFGTHIGNLIITIMYAYDPDAVILGGNISKSFNLFKASMYKQLEEFPYKESVKKIKISVAKIENVSILGSTVNI